MKVVTLLPNNAYHVHDPFQHLYLLMKVVTSGHPLDAYKVGCKFQHLYLLMKVVTSAPETEIYGGVRVSTPLPSNEGRDLFLKL